MYEEGLGVSQNYVQAHRLYNSAASQGSDEALAARDQIAEKMSAEQIAQTKKLATAFLPVEKPEISPEPEAPPPAPSGEGTRPFDGAWILELQVEEEATLADARIDKRITISESRFSTAIEFSGYHGTIEGEIDRDGVLSVASELVAHQRWRGMIIYFTTSLRDGEFRASGAAKNVAQGQISGDYSFVLSRVSPSAQ